MLGKRRLSDASLAGGVFKIGAGIGNGVLVGV